MPSSRHRSVLTSRLVSTAPAGGMPQVLEDLRHAILAGHGPPGTLIPIDDVATFFGVSPIPVREALKTLLGEGLVEHVPRGGYSVAKLTFTEFSELYDVRQALEHSALRVATTLVGADDVAAVREQHLAFAETRAADDIEGYHRASREFHRAMIAAARMPRLLSLYDRAWNMTDPVRPMTLVTEEQREDFHDEHARMLEAFAAGDAETLVSLSTGHYAHLREAIAPLHDDDTLFRSDISRPGNGPSADISAPEHRP